MQGALWTPRAEKRGPKLTRPKLTSPKLMRPKFTPQVPTWFFASKKFASCRSSSPFCFRR
jgi:hypothetical protein